MGKKTVYLDAWNETGINDYIDDLKDKLVNTGLFTLISSGTYNSRHTHSLRFKNYTQVYFKIYYSNTGGTYLDINLDVCNSSNDVSLRTNTLIRTTSSGPSVPSTPTYIYYTNYNAYIAPTSGNYSTMAFLENQDSNAPMSYAFLCSNGDFTSAGAEVVDGVKKDSGASDSKFFGTNAVQLYNMLYSYRAPIYDGDNTIIPYTPVTGVHDGCRREIQWDFGDTLQAVLLGKDFDSIVKNKSPRAPTELTIDGDNYFIEPYCQYYQSNNYYTKNLLCGVTGTTLFPVYIAFPF